MATVGSIVSASPVFATPTAAMCGSGDPTTSPAASATATRGRTAGQHCRCPSCSHRGLGHRRSASYSCPLRASLEVPDSTGVAAQRLSLDLPPPDSISMHSSPSAFDLRFINPPTRAEAFSRSSSFPATLPNQTCPSHGGGGGGGGSGSGSDDDDGDASSDGSLETAVVGGVVGVGGGAPSDRDALTPPLSPPLPAARSAKPLSRTSSVASLSSTERIGRMVSWFDEFDDEAKNAVLGALLRRCGTPQLHLVSSSIEPVLHASCPPNCQDIITWLPYNLALHVFSLLDPASLCRCALVCRTYHALVADPWLWRSLCLAPQWRTGSDDHAAAVAKHTLQGGAVDYRAVFVDQYRVLRNWRTGRFTVRTFEGHTQGISCVQFDERLIVSGSSDRTIRVWSIKTNTACLNTLRGHRGTIRCLFLHNGSVVSGSQDETIKIWDVVTGECRRTFRGHSAAVRCLQVSDGKVVSGSYDSTLKVWDFETGRCELTLSGHDDHILCLQVDASRIISGSSDRTIKLWNRHSGRCLRTLAGHALAVTCLQFDSHKIISGSLDSSLKIWDLASGECAGTLDWVRSEGHTGVVRNLKFDSWRLVSAADDKTIKVWDLRSGKRLLTLQNHTGGVTCLALRSAKIVSGSYDHSIKLFDFEV